MGYRKKIQGLSRDFKNLRGLFIMEVKKKINQINESGLGNIKKSFSKISNRYKMQDTLTDLLYRNQSKIEKEHKSIKYCGKAVMHKDDKISIEIIKGKSVTVKNVIYCHSDICPVCSPLIQAKRAKLVEKSIEYAHNNGMTVYMITLTAPHYANTDYLTFAAKIQSGYSNLISAIKRMVKAGKLKYSLTNHIQNFEVTYSAVNGYHPHKHCLLFFESAGVNEKELEKDVKRIWKRICLKSGLLSDKNSSDFDERAVDLKYCKTANNYLQKIHHEVTNKTNKTARVHNLTYFDCLSDLTNLKISKSDDLNKIKKLETIIIGFVKIFEIAESLRFSKGFKSIVENYIESIPLDEEPEPVAGVDEIETITISKLTWEYIVQHKLRPELVSKALTGGADKVRLWLALLGFRLRYSLYSDCAVGA